MNSKSLIKNLLISGITIGALLLAYYQFFVSQQRTQSLVDNSFGWKIPDEALPPGGQLTNINAYSKIRAAGNAKGLPVRLRIPSIGVDTRIEDAYITPEGRMDVPAGTVNVAWYAPGTVPGQTGSAVIGGHYGIDRGVPRVFYNLNKLNIGDKIFILDDQNKTITFEVRSIRKFNRNDDTRSVFLSSDGTAHLNLITCEGKWNQKDNIYPDRRVVFTTKI